MSLGSSRKLWKLKLACGVAAHTPAEPVAGHDHGHSRKL